MSVRLSKHFQIKKDMQWELLKEEFKYVILIQSKGVNAIHKREDYNTISRHYNTISRHISILYQGI
jgi:hypothetical protein